MAIQSQQTCSICGTVFQGVAYEKKDTNDTNFLMSNHRTGVQCKHCGAYVCRSCEPKTSLKLFLGLRKDTCPKCGKPEWWGKRYWMYTGAYDAKHASGLLDGDIPDGAKYKDELLALLENCSDQVVELVFQEAEQTHLGIYNVGNKLFKLSNIAKIGALDAFKDGKIEERLAERALKHEGDDVRLHACLTLIRIEDILRSRKSVPVLLKALESEADSHIREQLAFNLTVLAWSKEIIDGLINRLLGDPNVSLRRMLAGKLHEAVGKERTINDRIIDGLGQALKDHDRPPKAAASLSELFEREPSVSEAAAESLGSIGSLAMNAVPALIQALIGVELFDTWRYTKALYSITGMNFGSRADKWQEWWEKNH